MIAPNIKTLLGDELAAQVETKLKGKGDKGKDLDLVVGNDGSFVPADKHEGVKAQHESAEKALKAAADALKAIGGSGDPAKIQADVLAAQGTMAQLESDHQAAMQGVQMDTALKLALAGKVHDPDDVIPLLDREQLQLDKHGNLVTDLEPLLKPHQEKKPYLFLDQKEDNKPPEIEGAKPAPPGKSEEAGAAQAGPTIF